VSPFTQAATSIQALAKRDWMIWATAVVLFGVLQFFLAKEAAGGRLFTATPTNYYHYATDALLSGQLSLRIPPRPELLSLTDPYDPALNQPYRAHDISLYHGKYYFYWGLSPAILFFAPLKIVTGWWPSESLAGAFFGVVCFAAFSWIILAIRRIYFPLAGHSTAILALLCLGTCSLLPSAAASDHVYGVPIACAAACYGIAWWAALRGVINPKRSIRWSLVSGLALAFTLGARPNYLLWTPAFLFVLVAAIQTRPREGWKIGFAALSPILIAVACLLWLNWKRFNHPLEFGLKYQLSGSRQIDAAVLGFKYLAANWKSYGWNPLPLDGYFPFTTLAPEAPFGIFSALPIAWLAFGLVGVGANRELRGWLRGVAMSCVLSFIAACLFSAAVQRYMIDFLPGIVLAGGVCALGLAHRHGRSLTWRWGLAVLLVVSVLVGSLLQIQSWSVSRPTRMRLLRPLARLVNRPVFAWDALHASPSGGLRVVVRFPKGPLGAYEPILSVPAKPSGGELVFVHYVDARHVRLGFFQTATTHWLSEPISTDYSATHVIDIRLGSLVPPESHPAYGGWPEAAVQAALGQVDLTFDDEPVYHTVLDFGSSHAAQFLSGRNSLAPGASGPAFSGEILSTHRLPLLPPAPPLRGSWMTNPIDFSFQMIPARDPAKEEVFFSALDAEGRSTLLVIKHLSGSSIAFVLKTSGQPDREGPALPSPSVGPHRLLLTVGPWLVNAPPEQRSRVAVRLDDDLVLSGSTDGTMSPPVIALAGRPAAQASSPIEPFGGYITEAIPVPATAIALTASARHRLHYGPWRLRVRFPTEAPHGYHDPLLVSGVAGKGDFIYVFYPKPGEVAFGHDCWGLGGETSLTVTVDLTLEHQIEIEHGGLYPPLDDPLWAAVSPSQRTDYKTKLRVRLDGVVVLEGGSNANDASPISITPGINSIGGSSTGPRFLGQLLSVERLDW
jgi:hypothetical protein